MTVLKTKTACKYCPWRRTSARGWLGSSTPEEFLVQCTSEAHMPCHITIDYDDPDWADKLDDASHCAGSLIFMKNSCKQPRDPVLAAMQNKVETSDELFAFGSEFIDHHGDK
jgi:hypothetical protein